MMVLGNTVLPQTPLALAILLACLGVGLWVLLHWRRVWPGDFARRAAMVAGRTLVGLGTVLMCLRVMSEIAVPATNWPAWVIALIAAGSVEAVLIFYSLERRTLPRGKSFALAALRVGLVLLVTLVLAQPVRTLELEHKLRKQVAVLVDESASMCITDSRLGDWEKVRLAEALSKDSPARPFRLEQTLYKLEKIRQALLREGDVLNLMLQSQGDARNQQLANRRDQLNALFAWTEKELTAHATAVEGPLKSKLPLVDETKAVLLNVKSRLAGPVRDGVLQCAGFTDSKKQGELAANLPKLAETLRRTTGDLAELTKQLETASQAVDNAFFVSLPDARKAQVEALTRLSRVDLAKRLLVGPSADPLAQKLAQGYGLKLYTFAQAASRARGEDWRGGASSPSVPLEQTTKPAGAPTSMPAERQSTDLSGALATAIADTPTEQLAGIVVFWDGRHNGPRRPEPLAAALGAAGAPICSVVPAGARPPIDAAVISVDCPDTVYLKDKMFVDAELKLDGLAGKDAKVVLLDGDKQVDLKTVKAVTDSVRTRVQLGDQPQAKGLHHYRVQVESFAGEAFASNNEFPLTVAVTDDRTRLLLIDDRPRWDFRYLKNLFADRDKSVQLQYVLFHPDTIEGAVPAKSVKASASRPADDIEATDLPENEAEWMKFDVIILGDVSPAQLSPAHQAAIRKFVCDRGGTLIVMAGPQAMPHAFVGTPLEDLLPVQFNGTDKPQDAGPDPVCRLQLTAAGRQHVVMRQKVEARDNALFWEQLPELYWRAPIVDTKPGATVLAYAMPPNSPAFLKEDPAAGDVSEQRRAFERSRALIAAQNVAAGQVMFIGFDQTYRLRYRTGDTYHHRFWGGVLRWATAGKLPAGTNLVKLGADARRYSPHEVVTAQARLVKQDFSPVVSDNVAVKVFAGERLVLRKKLDYQADSQGLYKAELGELPAGTYRLELDAPAAVPLLAADNVDKVTTEFSVDPIVPREQAELTVDRGLMGTLAAMTGGAVFESPQASRVMEFLGEKELTRVERRQYVLWDSWPLFAMMVLLAACEWLLRKKVGLA